MIPPLSQTPLITPPYAKARSNAELRTQFLALAIIASTAFLFIAPWELAVPIGGCILLTALFYSLISCEPMPMQPVHVSHHYVPIPTSCHQPLVSPPRYLRSMRTPTHFAAQHQTTSSARAPVGTEMPTRFISRLPVEAGFNPLTRAPVGRQ